MTLTTTLIMIAVAIIASITGAIIWILNQILGENSFLLSPTAAPLIIVIAGFIVIFILGIVIGSKSKHR